MADVLTGKTKLDHTMIIIYLILSTLTMANCYCPADQISITGHCAFTMVCKGDLRGASLPPKCRGSTNYDVTIDLRLTDAVETITTDVDTDLLSSVTTLQAFGDWPQTSLSILDYMKKLKYLYLSRNRINYIPGKPFYQMSFLQTVDLSFNNISDIRSLFQSESQPNQLRQIFLSHNIIREIPAETFGELTFLTELDLSYNLISDLTVEPFSNLTNLKLLRLNNNRIKNLNGAVNGLKNLKHLYLRGNEIEHIDEESLTVIYHLQTFDVSDNRLEVLQPIMFLRHWHHIGESEAKESVCKIIMSDNHIISLPNATKEIASRFERNTENNHTVEVFTELDLSNNFINNIEYDAFQTIYQLASLDLSHNRLVDFNVNAEYLSHVKHLDLSFNYLSYLYRENLHTMKNLQSLDLSHNRLSTIPADAFKHLNNLKYLNLTFNDFKEVNRLNINSFHQDGGVLDLSNNDISRFFIESGDGLRMYSLKLHANNISDVSNIDLSYHTDLISLELKKNVIEELDEWSLRVPHTLIELDLSENFIKLIRPSTFQRLGHLRTLRLSYNNLESIEFGAFKGLTSLWHLDLSFNKFKVVNSKTFMDLQSLRTLSLRYNGMYLMDYSNWLEHRFQLTVYIEGNNVSCEWLGTALKNFNNGFSKMRPAVLTGAVKGHSVEGVPCVPKDKVLSDLTDASPRNVLIDERLLLTNQKILEAIKEQTSLLRNFFGNQIHYVPRLNFKSQPNFSHFKSIKY